MKAFKLALFTLLFISISCKEDTTNGSNENLDSVSTFYLIRHAEKDRSDPNDPDPELNQQGLGRAMHWAEIFDDIPLDAIYATNYNRTSMTAAPTSVKKNVDVTYFDPRVLDISQFKEEYTNKNVLIVGHSNTTPEFVNNLLGENRFDTLDDSDNGSLFIVTISNDIASVSRLHFNCSSSD